MTATVKNRGKELFLDIFYDIAGSLFMAIGIFCFMETADIAPGGVSGVSIMIKYLFGVPVGFMSLWHQRAAADPGMEIQGTGLHDQNAENAFVQYHHSGSGCDTLFSPVHR